MDDEIADDFALHVARTDELGPAVDLDVEQGAGESTRLVEGIHGLVIDGNEFRGLLVAVTHGGDAACEAHRANSPLAALPTCPGPRPSAASGQRVSVRVDLGGPRLLPTTTTTPTTHHTTPPPPT